jgi:endonuclease/exonuclease/phosphatase family metal-dependent hydrolase
VGLRTAFWTWDLAWQDGLAPLVLTLALGAATLALLVLDPETAGEGDGPVRVRTLILLGPFLMLQILFLQSPAFVASASGAPLPAAAAVILAADALAVAALSSLARIRIGRASALGAALALIVASALLRAIDGPAIALVVLVAGPLAAGVLMVGLTRPGMASTSLGRTAAAMAGADVTFVLLTFAYQVHYDIPLPVSNAWLPPLAALLLAAPAVLRGPSPERGPAVPWRLALAPLLLMLVPLAITLTRTSGVVSGSGGVRVLDYNLHMAVNLEGQVDPETLARTIEEQDPDVVVLQEVARGWVTNGTTDLAEWMSRRLGMPYVFGPAADGQFGNVVLSRVPIVSSETGPLGRFDGNMDRGWVRVEVDVGPVGHDGQARLVVIGTHLQHREQDTPTRLQQIDVLMRDAWRGDATTVIAGDMNDFPDSEEFAAFTDRGFVSAQDEAGEGDLPTSWRDGTRIDYVFATTDLLMSDFLRPYSEASDHLPLVVTVRPA